MRIRVLLRAALAAALLAVSAPSLQAQVFESVGVRAQGMGGAFVGVADDASATWWNPAGLAGGAYFEGIFEVGRSQAPRIERDPGGAATGAWRAESGGFAVAYPAFGLSYYRLIISEIRAEGPTATSASGRQDPRRGFVLERSFAVQQFGVTLDQSLGEHLVVGSTLKVLRGSLATAYRNAGDASLAAAGALDGDGRTRGDLDVGVMASLGPVRAGLILKNATAPTFSAGAEAAQLARQARVGLSVTPKGGPGVGALTVAVDADLTRVETAAGGVRRVAAGVEGWLAGRRLGVRGGVSASTIGEARPSVSGGLSAAIRPGKYVEGQLTGGGDSARMGWGIDLRVTF